MGSILLKAPILNMSETAQAKVQNWLGIDPISARCTLADRQVLKAFIFYLFATSFVA